MNSQMDFFFFFFFGGGGGTTRIYDYSTVGGERERHTHTHTDIEAEALSEGESLKRFGRTTDIERR